MIGQCTVTLAKVPLVIQENGSVELRMEAANVPEIRPLLSNVNVFWDAAGAYVTVALPDTRYRTQGW
jgi:hypothetical protein